MSADAAVRGIREIDRTGSIELLGLEADPPYSRPPLSKGMWKGRPFEKVWLKTEELQVNLQLGRKAISLNPDERSLQDDQGVIHRGEKLLLAIGGTPRRLPFGGDLIIYYRTLADYRRLSQLSVHGMDFAVIGGGFIGSEIAAALAKNGKHVRLLFPEEGIGSRMFPHDLSQFLNDFYRAKGVEVLPGETVTQVESSGGRTLVRTKNGRDLAVDGVVAGIGLQPNLELAQSAGLHVAGGILVDEYLATSAPGIFAAGDVAEFFNPALGQRLRVEHEDNAVTMGRQAGRNMAGAREPYHHLPYFYSDLFELGYEAVGELEAGLTTHADWEKPFEKGVVYYLRQDRVCGVLLWNVWDKIPKARELISASQPFQPDPVRR
jgi:NADPH-dependent 2,4-dienoyl-CoA reductase/sulfur reductase-like enzyme